MDHSGDSTAADAATPPVDILVAGVPGPLMRWTFDLLARAVAGRYLSVVHSQIGEDGRWNPPDAGSDQAARLFVGEVLPEAWAAPIRDGRIAAVLVIDDVSLAWERLRQMGQPAAEAARNLVAIATSFGDVAGHDRVLTVTRSAGNDQVALAARILTHVGLPVAMPDQLFAMLAAGGPAQVPWDLPPPIPIPTESVPMIEAMVLSAFEYGRSRTRVRVIWPRECLFWGDRPNEALPRVLDLTGPSRILAYGPYLPLPPGRWTMSTTLALSPASRGAVLSLRLFGPTELGRITLTVEEPGLFKASAPVTVPSPREPLEIHLVTERGAIEGTIGVDHIAFDPDQS